MSKTTAENNKALINGAPNKAVDEIDLGELLGVLIDGKWLIILFMFIFFFFGVAKAFLESPVYRADAMLQINENAQTLAGLETLTDLFEKKCQ